MDAQISLSDYIPYVNPTHWVIPYFMKLEMLLSIYLPGYQMGSANTPCSQIFWIQVLILKLTKLMKLGLLAFFPFISTSFYQWGLMKALILS